MHTNSAWTVAYQCTCTYCTCMYIFSDVQSKIETKWSERETPHRDWVGSHGVCIPQFADSWRAWRSPKFCSTLCFLPWSRIGRVLANCDFKDWKNLTKTLYHENVPWNFTKLLSRQLVTKNQECGWHWFLAFLLFGIVNTQPGNLITGLSGWWPPD